MVNQNCFFFLLNCDILADLYTHIQISRTEKYETMVFKTNVRQTFLYHPRLSQDVLKQRIFYCTVWPLLEFHQ